MGLLVRLFEWVALLQVSTGRPTYWTGLMVLLPVVGSSITTRIRSQRALEMRPSRMHWAVLQSDVIVTTLSYIAVWFPLVVALIAAIVALTGPFRRVQTVVATPSAQTNWTPSTAPAVAATGAAATTAAYSQQYPQQYPQQQYGQPSQYAQQYPPQLGSQAMPPAAPPPQPAASYAPSGYVAPTTPYPSSQPTTRVPDAPPTMLCHRAA